MLSYLRPLTCVVAMCAATTLTAQETQQFTEAELTQANFIENVGGSERINFSGKLRMLSQRIPASACYAHYDIETEASKKMLFAATVEFDLILNGLEFGEDSLGIIGPESDRKVLAGLHKLHSKWDPHHIEIEHVIENGGSDAEIASIAGDSHGMLDIAKKLVSAISGEYSDPTALLQADALTIDIAGRQRMLAQRISKNVCLIAAGLDTERAMKEIAGAQAMYDASVNALRFGMPDAGIIASTNPDILSRLDSVLALWADVQPIINAAKSGEAIGAEQQAFMFNSANSLTGQMNTIVGMYSDDSKLGL